MELKGELTIYKAALINGMLVSGTRDKFRERGGKLSLGVEQYFRAMGIKDGATKVKTISSIMVAS